MRRGSDLASAGNSRRRTPSWLMNFLAIASLRISLKLNISAAREQQAVGLGPLM